MTTETTPAIETISPGSYEASRHFYPRVPNAQLHPMVRHFLGLDNERIALRYCHLHPEADRDAVRSVLQSAPKWFRWSGADLFHTTTDSGHRHMVVIETNSSPSGQKSMPLIDDNDDQGGYSRLLSRTFVPMLQRRGLPEGRLAVLWDKNEMEVRAYAAVLADLTSQDVLLVYVPTEAAEERLRCVEGVIEVFHDGDWVPLRACFRYVTQRPWSRIPPITRTLVFNPILVCLAGGRNKLVASKAYDLYNGELEGTGLQIRVPETVTDVGFNEVPLWVRRMGGIAVVKNPYSNAGQGVYTITTPEELEAFESSEQRYQSFIVQSLIGNAGWSSRINGKRFYHVGTVPDKRGRIFVADLRFMVGADRSGFYPLGLYARRAREPLSDTLDGNATSWDMLGTNLSEKTQQGWTTDSNRLMLMDARDFSRLGLGIDDLVEAYLQTVLSTTAIDRMAQALVTQKGRFRRRLFSQLNPDDSLMQEICS